MEEEMKKLQKKFQKDKEEIRARFVAERDSVLRIKRDILIKMEFIVIVAVLVIIVVLGKDIMAAVVEQVLAIWFEGKEATIV